MNDQILRQFLCWNMCKQKQSPLFNLNIFHLLTSKTEKIAWWPHDFKPENYISRFNEQQKKI